MGEGKVELKSFREKERSEGRWGWRKENGTEAGGLQHVCWFPEQWPCFPLDLSFSILKIKGGTTTEF